MDKFDFLSYGRESPTFGGRGGGGGGGQNAKDCAAIWHACYWPGENQLVSLHRETKFFYTP